MKKLRVAIVGAGQVARKSHIANYKLLKDVELVAISDVNLESAKIAAEQSSIPLYFGSHIEMFEIAKPDAISICVPNKFHCEITCDALEKGIHVLCEKPPAITIEEAIKMDNLANKYNCLLTYGFHFRHGGNVKLLKEKINQGEFGEVYGANVQWIRRRGIPGWGNFINKDIQGGGPLIDIGAHMLDLAVYFMDYPKIDYVCATSHDKIGKKFSIGLMGNWEPKNFTIEDALFGFIKFSNGASINLETAFALNIKEKDIRNVQLFGDKLGASVFPLEIFGNDKDQLTNISYPFDNGNDLHSMEINNFVNACLGNEELIVTSKQGIYIQTLICSLYESANTGKPVVFNNH